MYITNLSSKGQLVIPKHIRRRYGWKPGQQFELLIHQDGVFLRLHKPFPPTQLHEVAGCMDYKGPVIPVEQMKGKLAIARKHDRD